MMDKEEELCLLQITAQYVAEIQAGSQPHLSDYLARYPRYADAIADFVAYYHAVEETMVSMDVIPLTDVMMPSRDATRGCMVNRVSMTSLLHTATGQRLTLSQLATELDLSVDIVLLLEQRAIAPTTIPHVLYDQIARLLQRPSTEVQEYFCSLGQCQSQSVIPKRKQQTKVAEESTDYTVSHVEGKPSFRAVVETSLQLSAEQRDRWGAVLDSQKPQA